MGPRGPRLTQTLARTHPGPPTSSTECQACRVNPLYCWALLTSWKILAARAQDSHLSISRELISKREVCGFALSFQETKGPLPGRRGAFPVHAAGLPTSKAVQSGPCPCPDAGGGGQGDTCICPGTCAHTELPAWEGGVRKLLEGWGWGVACLLVGVGMTNGSRWAPCLPSCWIIHLRGE